MLAWQGVSVVADQVTDDRPAPLAASEIEAQLAAADPPTSTTVAPPPSSTTAPPISGDAAETRTYNVQGGTAALRFTTAGVTVVFANPAAGFSVAVEPEHGNGVKVEFESDSHESRVDGWWADGPVDRVREDGDRDDGSDEAPDDPDDPEPDD